LAVAVGEGGGRGNREGGAAEGAEEGRAVGGSREGGAVGGSKEGGAIGDNREGGHSASASLSLSSIYRWRLVRVERVVLIGSAEMDLLSLRFKVGERK
jgi:hypothetical protein